MINLDYTPTPTGLLVHNDEHKIRAVMGPPSSGKSVMNAVDLIMRATRQIVADDNVRYSKWLVVRRSVSDLLNTTIPTLQHWLPADCGTISKSTTSIRGVYRFSLSDGTEVHMELIFLPVGDASALARLDSLEVTGAWINEAGEASAEVFSKVYERVARYPPYAMFKNFYAKHPELDGSLAHISWYGVMMDYNPPDRTNWLVNFFENNTNPDAILIKQPPALLEIVDPDTNIVTDYIVNPRAENPQSTGNGKKYLEDLAIYKAQGNYGMIETRLLCRYGTVAGSKQVFNNFVHHLHVSPVNLDTSDNEEVLIGFDTSGLHPCALFLQHFNGVYHVVEGILGEEIGLEDFIDSALMPIINSKFNPSKAILICDPSNPRDSYTGITPIARLREKRLKAIPAYTNKFSIRREAVDLLFYKNRLLIDPRLSMLIKGCMGEYQYKPLRTTTLDGMPIYTKEPDKSVYSHWADALQYAALYITRKSELTQQTLDRYYSSNSIKSLDSYSIDNAIDGDIATYDNMLGHLMVKKLSRRGGYGS